MMVVRGVNIFPSSIEAIVREFPSIGEYRIVLSKAGALDQLQLEIEEGCERAKSEVSEGVVQTPSVAESLGRRLQNQLQLRVDVRAVPPGTLPKPEGKARRIVDIR
jgi:phenylacetate-CoA ligase